MYLTECHSTNDIAAERIKQDQAFDGDVILTDHQTAGRGQRGNRWFTEPGQNLTMSIVLLPRFLRPAQQFQLTMVTSLALTETIDRFLTNDRAQIKWPNDIYVGSQKIAGILIECAIRQHQITSAIIGIGLNVNQDKFEVSTATSLRLIGGKSVLRKEVMEQVFQRMQKYYMKLKSQSFQSIKEEYLSKLYWRSEVHQFRAEETFSGTIKDVDENGRLIVDVQGQLRMFNLKEIKFLQ